MTLKQWKNIYRLSQVQLSALRSEKTDVLEQEQQITYEHIKSDDAN